MATNSGGRRSDRRSGYVLIMTLVLITIAALSLSGLARRSLLLASDSIAAERELQRYWGASSCRKLLLDQAEKIFKEAEAPHVAGELPWPALRVLVADVVLAKMKYRLWLSDEDAKLNLNSLTARLPQQRRNILGQLIGQQNPLQLDPNTSPTAKQQQRWFASWGQVVDVTQFGNVGTIDSLMSVATDLTCWGSGKLNIRRVSDQTLLLLASKVVNQKIAHKLLDARAEATELDLKELLNSLALRRRDELALRAWFTDRSTCFNLWLELEDGQRKWYHQWVQGDRTSANADPILSFHW